MPIYQYTVLNTQGQSARGTIPASSSDEARSTLESRGFQVMHLAEQVATGQQILLNQPSPPSQQPPAVPRSTPPPVTPPSSMPPLSRPSAPRPIPTPQPTRPDVVHTRRASDKKLYFIFSQLASYFRSGLNAQRAFSDVAGRCGRSDYRESLNWIAQQVTEGSMICDAMERYPDLYPPHTVGTVRAGETGGFLPEALDAIAKQALASHRIKRWFVWLGAMILVTAICYPIGDGAVKAALATWDAQDKAGGTLPPMATFLNAAKDALIHAVIPAMLIILAVWIGAGAVWGMRSLRPLRHLLVLYAPGLAKRARSESLAAFSWTMSKLSQGGIPPRRTWEIACQAIPNLEIRRRLEAVGEPMGDGGKISHALYQSRVVPQEFAPIVETGEITGDVPGALMSVAESSYVEYEGADKMTRARIGCWMLLVMFAGLALTWYLFYGVFYPKLIPKILGE